MRSPSNFRHVHRAGEPRALREVGGEREGLELERHGDVPAPAAARAERRDRRANPSGGGSITS